MLVWILQPTCFVGWSLQNIPQPKRTNNAATWWQSEDELLVQGMRRFGKNASLIRMYFLPAKDEKSILARIKTRSSNRAGENSIKVSYLLFLAVSVFSPFMFLPWFGRGKQLQPGQLTGHAYRMWTFADRMWTSST